MLTTFIIFLVSLVGIGLLVGRRLATGNLQADPQHPWYRVQVRTVEYHLWRHVRRMTRYVLLGTVVEGLQSLGKGSTRLARKTHAFVHTKLKHEE